MNKSVIGTLLISSTLLCVAMSFLYSQNAVSDDDFFTQVKHPGVLPVKDKTYIEECSSCHMAYSPGLLPQKSWAKIMNNLENHFGDNAEILPNDNKQILAYLQKNSAEKSPYYRSKKIARSLSKNKIVDRITNTPYFLRKHDEIPKKFVTGNPKVRSFSQCNLCHQNTKNGSFNEDEISIPGVGYWHD